MWWVVAPPAVDTGHWTRQPTPLPLPPGCSHLRSSTTIGRPIAALTRHRGRKTSTACWAKTLGAGTRSNLWSSLQAVAGLASPSRLETGLGCPLREVLYCTYSTTRSWPRAFAIRPPYPPRTDARPQPVHAHHHPPLWEVARPPPLPVLESPGPSTIHGGQPSRICCLGIPSCCAAPRDNRVAISSPLSALRSPRATRPAWLPCAGHGPSGDMPRQTTVNQTAG